MHKGQGTDVLHEDSEVVGSLPIQEDSSDVGRDRLYSSRKPVILAKVKVLQGRPVMKIHAGQMSRAVDHAVPDIPQPKHKKTTQNPKDHARQAEAQA